MNPPLPPARLLADDELLSLEPREHLSVLRDALAHRMADGRPVDTLLAGLAERDSTALAELIVGARALRGAAVVRAALGVVGALEAAVSPAPLYRRLADLAGVGAVEVLRTAAERHPRAPWLLGLSKRIEGVQCGVVHLRARAGHPDFPEICEVHAEAGHQRGLVQVAGDLGSPWPAVALLRAGAVDAAAEAAVRALERDPSCPVIQWLAAVWGPDLDPLLTRMIPYLRDLAMMRLFRGVAGDRPGVRRRLDALELGLPGGR